MRNSQLKIHTNIHKNLFVDKRRLYLVDLLFALNSWLPTMLLVGIIFGIVNSTVSQQYDIAGILVIALSFMFSFIFIVFAVKINELQKEIQNLKRSHEDIDWELNKTINELEKKYPTEE